MKMPVPPHLEAPVVYEVGMGDFSLNKVGSSSQHSSHQELSSATVQDTPAKLNKSLVSQAYDMIATLDLVKLVRQCQLLPKSRSAYSIR